MYCYVYNKRLLLYTYIYIYIVYNEGIINMVMLFDPLTNWDALPCCADGMLWASQTLRCQRHGIVDIPNLNMDCDKQNKPGTFEQPILCH